MQDTIYFFRTQSDKNEERRLRALPFQTLHEKDGDYELKKNINAKMSQQAKERFNNYPLGTVFAVDNVEDFGGYYVVNNIFPVSCKSTELKNPSDKPTPEMLNSYKNYLAIHGADVFDAESGENKMKKGTLLSALHEKYPVPTIKGDGFTIPAQDWLFLIRNIYRREPILLTGPSGTGKTAIVKLAADKMGLPFHWFDMGVTIDPISTLLGTHRIKNGDSVFDYAAFALAVQQPGVILLDELSRAPALALNLLFPCLDDRRTLPVEQASGDDQRSIPIHPDCTFVATANINGNGGQFSGTNTLDDALLNRFHPLEMNYPSAERETALLVQKCSIEDSDARVIVKIAGQLRNLFENSELSKPVSTRETLSIGRLVNEGYEVYEAIKRIILPLYSDKSVGGEREMVQNILAQR